MQSELCQKDLFKLVNEAFPNLIEETKFKKIKEGRKFC